MIPKIIYTVWLSKNGEIPKLIQKCIDSQIEMCNANGYAHVLLTLKNIPQDIQYLNDAINSTHPDGVKYCKATDYLRFWCLFNHGGVFLDSDTEVVSGKSFDEMLNEKMFIGLELADWANGRVVLGTAILGSELGHPFLKYILNEMDTRFSGSDCRNYDSSMAILNESGVNFQDQFTLYEPEYFHPKNSFTGQLDNLTEKTICIHQFTKLWTPENNPLSTLQQFKYNIENNINFTFVKRGDGEIACMNGESGGNCDGHPYSPELAQALKEAYSYLHSVGATIVEFEDQKNYNVLLHRTDNNLEELAAFYKAIAKSERPKYFIGPQRLEKIWWKLLKAEHINVMEVNAFAHYGKVWDRIPIVKDGIYIFCCGMPAKPLISDLKKHAQVHGYDLTCLDCGSAFDPSFSETRTWQISKEQFVMLYFNELVNADDFIDIDLSKVATGTRLEVENESELIIRKTEEGFEMLQPIKNTLQDQGQNNFLLPQATHPERLWVIDNIK